MAACGSYKHQPLDLHKSQIRLFRLSSKRSDGILEGEITTHDFEDKPIYRAVSYTWGPPSPTRQISINGLNLSVRENLWQFLNSAFDLRDTWLWIDQICIDQDTVKERNHQVGLMSTIFARAEWVFIWLGSEADGSNEAMKAINSGSHATRQHAKQVQALFDRPYWSRLWIIQEVLMNQKASVLCGNQCFELWQLARMYVPNPGYDGDIYDFRPVEINETVLSLISELFSFDTFEKQKLSFILQSFAKSQCEDPRDKVYGLLSLVRDSGRIAVDYSRTPTEVFFDTVQRIVQDERFMEFESHVDVAKYLRDSMSLPIETSVMESYIISESKITRNVKEYENRDTMLQAARKGNIERVRVLLHNDRTGIEKRDYLGYTPIMWAIREGHRIIAKLLIYVGDANLDVRDYSGKTPLILAVDQRHRDIVEILLKSGQVDVREEDESGNSALSQAAHRGDNDMVRLLLDADDGYEGDVRTWYLSEAVALAAANNQKESIQIILSTEDADSDAKRLIVGRALGEAASHGRISILAMMLARYGADINFRAANGDTPLLVAAKLGQEDMVNFLLRRENILVNAQNNDGLTPLMAAAAEGYLKVAEILLGTGKAGIEAKDLHGRTAIDIAETEGHEELVQLLRTHSGGL